MGMPRINRGNEAAGRISAMLGEAGRTGGPAGPSASLGVYPGTEGPKEIKRINAEAGSTTGSTPGSAPHRGLTTPGVVEAMMATAMEGTRKTPPIDPTTAGQMAINEMRVKNPRISH